MSYYSNRGNISPGAIQGSALDGLHTRVAISVNRVLDSCCKQVTLENHLLALTGQEPAPTPYTFVSATSTEVGAVITNLNVTRLEERPQFARVRCTVNVPIKVTYDDSTGVAHTAFGTIAVSEDIIMYVPEASVFPFEIVASASCNCVDGTFVNDSTIECTACLTIITKVVAETDLLVPTYGYCPSPKAVDFGQQACASFFELPLYPSGK